MGTYTTLEAPGEYTLDPVKGSRFIATLAPVETVDEAAQVLARVSAAWPDASHHCWAWRLRDERARSSDDGEPGGSAGRPILAQIDGHGVVDVVVVVSRWFGGTKLGVGGLMRAYGGCAGKALDRAALRVVVATLPLVVTCDWADSGGVDRALARAGLVPLETDYGARVRRTLAVPEDDVGGVRRALMDATGGRADID